MPSDDRPLDGRTASYLDRRANVVLLAALVGGPEFATDVGGVLSGDGDATGEGVADDGK